MLTDNLQKKLNIPELIQQQNYVQHRLSPQPGQADYLHLSDLRLALESVKTEEPIQVLDYGCGGSPYRSLFPNANYKRADYSSTFDLDYIIDDDSRIDEADGSFDLILSTQVVEHVSCPAVYFQECFRLLKQGGRLICSTHGSFPDHACPHDYQRWTVFGLRRDIEAAGFICQKASKLTTGPRALLYLVDRFSSELFAPRSTVFGAALWGWRSLLNKKRAIIHKQCDSHFVRHRVVDEDPETHSFYVALLMIALKN